MFVFDCEKSDRSQACVERGAIIDVVGLGGRRDCLMFLGGRREIMFTERNNVGVCPCKSLEITTRDIELMHSWGFALREGVFAETKEGKFKNKRKKAS